MHVCESDCVCVCVCMHYVARKRELLGYYSDEMLARDRLLCVKDCMYGCACAQ